MTNNICVQNYDFGSNWNEVLKHLTFPETYDWIKLAFDEYNPCCKEYARDSSPAELFSKGDSYAQLILDLTEIIRDGDYPDIISEEEKIYQYEDCEQCDDGGCDECENSFNEIEQLIINRAGYNFEYNQDKLAFYVPFGSCHAWNKFFGLPLAKKVLPDREWKLRHGEDHTTVYSEATNEVFDIIFWGLDGRLCEHELSRLNCTRLRYSSIDSSLGGNLAYEMSK